jgi:uncharacterized protein (TIGR03435 family)
MFKTLLAERFKLQFHRERMLMPVYNVIGQNGLKIQESTAGPGVLPSFPVQVSPPPRVITVPARNVAMWGVATMLQRVLADKPVVDKTGFSGRYNFDLQWSPDAPKSGGAANSGTSPGNKPDIFTALQQLGLELVPAQGVVGAIVVDYAEQPGKN